MLSTSAGDAPSVASTDGSAADSSMGDHPGGAMSMGPSSSGPAAPAASSMSMNSNNAASSSSGGGGAMVVAAQQQNQSATSATNASAATNSSGGGGSSSLSSLDSQIERLKRCEYLRENEVKALCLRAREILVDEGNVQRVDAPVTVSVLNTIHSVMILGIVYWVLIIGFVWCVCLTAMFLVIYYAAGSCYFNGGWSHPLGCLSNNLLSHVRGVGRCGWGINHGSVHTQQHNSTIQNRFAGTSTASSMTSSSFSRSAGSAPTRITSS